jgi:hypothetical protein
MYETYSTAGELFAQDAVLPEQFYGDTRSKALEPERRLMLALLTDAVRCYQSGVDTPSGTRTQVFAEAENWIFHAPLKTPFSFEDVCNALEIDPAYLRKGLRRWRDQKLAKGDLRLIRRLPVVIRGQVKLRVSRPRTLRAAHRTSR